MPPREAKSMQDYVNNEDVLSRIGRASGSGVQRAISPLVKAAKRKLKMKGHYREPIKATPTEGRLKVTPKTRKATPAEIKKEAAKKRAARKAARTRGGGRYEQLR